MKPSQNPHGNTHVLPFFATGINPKRLTRIGLFARKNGFSLIVTIIMMVLLTVIAVGLLSLSTISLRNLQHNSSRTLAQNNARIALMFALSELQKHTGQDQRVTAVADMAGSSVGAPIPAGQSPSNNATVAGLSKSLSAVQQGTRYWTGVWRNAASNPTTEIYNRTPSPRLIKWLVSGNETQAYLPSWTAGAVNSSGNANTPSAAVVLVGNNTVGSASTSTLPQYVTAPLVTLTQSGSSGDKTIGRYAWWIGDEGLKAKMNLASDTTSPTDASYETLVAQRSGWDAVNGFGNFPNPSAGNALKAASIITLNQAELLDASLRSGTPSPIQRSFHSATSDSFGVLSDNLNGGLRLDLSSYLSKTLPSSLVPGMTNSPLVNRNLIPSSAATGIQGPRWDALKNFFSLSNSLQNGKLAVKAANNDLEPAIAPILLDIRLLCGAKLKKESDTSYKIHPCAKVAIVIANPYAYPLTWSSGMDLEFRDNSPSGTRPSCIWNIGDKAAYLPYNGGPSVLGNTYFQIPAGELQPGEAKAFTVGSTFTRPAGTTGRLNVPLVPFAGSGASNFSNCVLLENSTSYTIAGPTSNLPSLDVRESSNTSQLMVQLRPAGASTLLRQIDNFELDNGYYGATQRTYTGTQASQLTEPIPLQLYSFQISQPGADYASLLPDANKLGIRSSTVRTFADFNLQATRFRKPIASYNPPPYFMESSQSKAGLPDTAPGGDTGNFFTRNLASSQIFWGRNPAGGTSRMILFSVPKSFVSLAQFQHADLTADEVSVSVAHQPGNAFANSYAPPFVKRTSTLQFRNDYKMLNTSSATTTPVRYFDLSYLLNAALWDSYFFSSIPASGNTVPLNDRILRISSNTSVSDLRDGLKAASQLYLNGSFNINSTDKNAWKAVLAGMKHLKHPADSSTSSTDALFARSLEQLASAKSPATGTDDDSFSGFRRLNDSELDSLAEEITRQVRLRGPFVSLSHFVNRALVDIGRNKILGRSGALQSALDQTVNINIEGTRTGFSKLTAAADRLTIQSSGNYPIADMPGSRATTVAQSEPDPVWSDTSADLQPGAMGSIYADRTMLTDPSLRLEQGYRSTGIPGWVTQADVLQSIGPVISSRSDTFRIRAYGEAVDPVTGNTTAKAWCEAVVQRTPQYIDPTNAPTDRGTSLTSLNQAFGRRYEIISFRWLSQDEI